MQAQPIELRDGRMLAAAPLRPADAAAVQAFVRSLSSQSRQERFFAPVAELSPRLMERLLATPGLSVAAWHAGGIVALAQYALSGRAAEFAVVVGEGWRGVGLGEGLVQLLLAHARLSGVRVLGGLTLERNRAMRSLAAKLGFTLRQDEDPALVRLERVLAPA
jgi:acetyltransferase